ncbi:methyltransferase domain-containing protein [Glycomyces sp. TRM65418]|uniref:class I SAM-dependent methyltransferase n=1 Tax=Glycomyces sp. TRM65418 TaxID=2867006 RepID=UPI001CE5E9E1|nr:class I SAM-dependent methyltransferase [Glycomyces sp. TRM65418]MCC3765038.1 methyltransferase domain-containing protein [Glycomyces sp. TRM65418]QZD54668.1 methyltransferase domain-containing protein [Glycomyces sp. TRM65418]
MLGETAYHGALGGAFAALSETGAYNAYIDRPAMRALAGDIAGLRVLDVGCGPGHDAAALAERGATVLGVDGSADLLEHARVRTGGALETLREPRAVPELEAVDAGSYERLDRNPSLLAALLRRP